MGWITEPNEPPHRCVQPWKSEDLEGRFTNSVWKCDECGQEWIMYREDSSSHTKWIEKNLPKKRWWQS